MLLRSSLPDMFYRPAEFYSAEATNAFYLQDTSAEGYGNVLDITPCTIDDAIGQARNWIRANGVNGRTYVLRYAKGNFEVWRTTKKESMFGIIGPSNPTIPVPPSSPGLPSIPGLPTPSCPPDFPTPCSSLQMDDPAATITQDPSGRDCCHYEIKPQPGSGGSSGGSGGQPAQTKVCWDGTSVPIDAECPAHTKECWDGSTVDFDASCPVQTQQCWDGSVIPVDQTCPVHTKECWDGSTIDFDASCPIETQECWDGSTIPVDQTCSASKNCPDGSTIGIGAECPVIDSGDGGNGGDGGGGGGGGGNGGGGGGGGDGGDGGQAQTRTCIDGSVVAIGAACPEDCLMGTKWSASAKKCVPVVPVRQSTVNYTPYIVAGAIGAGLIGLFMFMKKRRQ